MPAVRTWVAAIVLGGAGFALNLLPVGLMPGLRLLFGGVLAFVAALAFGAGPGALTGAIAASRSIFLWDHPYTLILLTLEAASVGLLRNRLRPVWTVGLYWLLFGGWLGLLFFGVLLDIPWQPAGSMVLKQALNGLVNGLLAEAVMLAPPVRRVLKLSYRPRFERYLSVLAALAAVIPLLAVWILDAYQLRRVVIGLARVEAEDASRRFAGALSGLRAGVVPNFAKLAAARKFPVLATLQVPPPLLGGLRPDGVVMKVDAAGRLRRDTSLNAAIIAFDAGSLVATTAQGSGVYRLPGLSRIPFADDYQQVFVAADRAGNTGWIVWAAMPFERIMSPVEQRVLTAEGVMLGALMLALLVALLIARQMEKPISAVVRATERLAAGDLRTRVNDERALAGGPAEAPIMAEHLDRMAAQLQRAEKERLRVLASERAGRRDAERRAREEIALREATQAVTATYTVDEVVQQIAASGIVAVGADAAYVERLDQVRGSLTVAAAVGDVHPPVGAVLRLEGSYAEAALKSGKPLVVPDVSAGELALAGGIRDSCPECAAMALPLLGGGRAIGALLLLRRGRQPFQEDEVRRAATFANLAALAFDRVHLLEEAEKRRREVEQVMESRARMIRGFSHDVKNPLGAADGYLQLLEEQILGELNERQRESVGRVREALRSALALITDLVELARAEAGQIEIERRTVDLGQLISDMAGQYRAQAEAKSLTLEMDIPKEFPLIRSDDRRIRQILGNLLSNAAKYTPEGGRIGVRLKDLGADKGVAIEVWDTGPGISAADRDRIFREFTRLEPGRTPGAGLGLAISRRVARAIGGDLTFESEPGRGSTFTLWLQRESP